MVTTVHVSCGTATATPPPPRHHHCTPGHPPHLSRVLTASKSHISSATASSSPSSSGGQGREPRAFSFGHEDAPWGPPHARHLSCLGQEHRSSSSAAVAAAAAAAAVAPPPPSPPHRVARATTNKKKTCVPGEFVCAEPCTSGTGIYDALYYVGNDTRVTHPPPSPPC